MFEFHTKYTVWSIGLTWAFRFGITRDYYDAPLWILHIGPLFITRQGWGGWGDEG